MPNLNLINECFETIPDGRAGGRADGQPVWWRMDNSANSDQLSLVWDWSELGKKEKRI